MCFKRSVFIDCNDNQRVLLSRTDWGLVSACLDIGDPFSCSSLFVNSEPRNILPYILTFLQESKTELIRNDGKNGIRKVVGGNNSG